jgi:hypothetical protein
MQSVYKSFAAKAFQKQALSSNANFLFAMRNSQMRYFASKVMNVPQMGDSITEGTI